MILNGQLKKCINVNDMRMNIGMLMSDILCKEGKYSYVTYLTQIQMESLYDVVK